MDLPWLVEAVLPAASTHRHRPYQVSKHDTIDHVLRPPDIVVLLMLLRNPGGEWTIRSLAEQLHMPPAAVQRSLARLGKTPVFDAGTRRVSPSASDELLAHALPFIAPASLGAPVRGVPTAWGAPPLAGEISEDDAPVWPDRHGRARGPALTPLHPDVPKLAHVDPAMHELLALVDALRVGRARERRLALAHLRERLGDRPVAA